MSSFSRYTPGVRKLLKFPEHLAKIKRGEPVAPLHVSIWPTRRCQADCAFCCCREERSKQDSLSLMDFSTAINVLAKYGTRAVEFSGGGEPLLWPWLDAGVAYAKGRGLKLSLVTNGLALGKTKSETLAKFEWVRVSVLSNAQIESVKFSAIPKGVNTSLSCIVSPDVDFGRLHRFAKDNGFMVRIAVKQPSDVSEDVIGAGIVADYGEPFYFSRKERGTPKGCYMPWIRAAIDWRGNFLPCPSVMLTPGMWEGLTSHLCFATWTIPKSF